MGFFFSSGWLILATTEYSSILEIFNTYSLDNLNYVYFIWTNYSAL